MQGRGAIAAIPGIALFIMLSSFLGLAGRFLPFSPVGGVAFMIGIWRASAAADVVFLAGSAMAAIVAFALAQRTNVGLAIVVGGLANWLVYFASFVMLPHGTIEVEDALGPAFLFVGAWGFVGLVFAALAPPLASLMWERFQSAPSRTAVAE